MQGSGLCALAWAVTAGEVTYPAAFCAVALKAPAVSVEVVTFSDILGDGVVWAEGFAEFDGQVIGLCAGCEFIVWHFGQQAEDSGAVHALFIHVFPLWKEDVNGWRWSVAQLAGEAEPIDMNDGLGDGALGFETELDIVAVKNQR